MKKLVSIIPNYIAFVAIVIAIVTMFITIDQLQLTREQINLSKKANSLAIKPQLDVYLRHDGEWDQIPEESKIVFGIKNIGVPAIDNLDIEISRATLNEQECLSNTGVGQRFGSMTTILDKTTKLLPGKTAEETIGLFSTPFDSSRAFRLYTIQISYRDESTGKYFSKQKNFFVKHPFIFTNNDVPNTEEIGKLIECAESGKMGTLFNKGATIHLLLED